MELEKIKEMLNDLSPSELEELKTFLNSNKDVEKDVESEEDGETSNTSTTDIAEEDDAEDVSATESEDKDKEDEVGTNKNTPPTLDDKAEKTAEKDDIEPIVEQTSATQNYDDIPKMQKGTESTIDDDVVNITAESGEEIPVDYEQIVEGLNAKIAALQAENASLKSKVEGAFGYSAKSPIPAKINKLYDECADVHFHK